MKMKGVILIAALLVPVAGIAKDKAEGPAYVPITAYATFATGYTATFGLTVSPFYDLTTPYLLHSVELRLGRLEGVECDVKLDLYEYDSASSEPVLPVTLVSSLWRADGDTSPVRLEFPVPVLIDHQPLAWPREGQELALTIHPSSGDYCIVMLNAIASPL